MVTLVTTTTAYLKPCSGTPRLVITTTVHDLPFNLINTAVHLYIDLLSEAALNVGPGVLQYKNARMCVLGLKMYPA